ncbi:hypothetical protein AAZV13_09G062600 [Glycine max]
MPPMSTIPIHRPEFCTLFFNGSPSPYKCPRITASWIMAMDSKFSSTIKNNSDNDYNLKKKKDEELSVQISTPPISKVETLNSNDLQFDRLQPSDQELGRVKRFEFGQFVARETVLDEEYWTAAWLRAESHWEDRPFERYVDNYKRKFAEQEFNALKRRCKVQNGDSCACIITVRKEQKNAKHSILKSVVGTLDLNIRYLLQGETYPGVLLLHILSHLLLCLLYIDGVDTFCNSIISAGTGKGPSFLQHQQNTTKQIWLHCKLMRYQIS